MNASVRSPVLGEGVPLFVIMTLAALGMLSALLAARTFDELASATGSEMPIPRPAASSHPVAATPRQALAIPALEPDESVISAPAAETTPSDCPEFPRFSFDVGHRRPADTLDDAVGVVVVWMEGHPDAVLIVEGHADATGGPKLNLGLSFERAQAVSELFVAKGLGRDRIDVEAYGAFRPIERREGSSAIDRRVTLRTGGEPVCPHRGGNAP